MCVVLVDEIELLRYLRVRLILNETLIALFCERCIKNNEYSVFESWVCGCFLGYVTQLRDFGRGLAEKQCEEYFVAFCLFAPVLNLVEQRIFINIKRVEFERVRAAKVDK